MDLEQKETAVQLTAPTTATRYRDLTFSVLFSACCLIVNGETSALLNLCGAAHIRAGTRTLSPARMPSTIIVRCCPLSHSPGLDRGNSQSRATRRCIPWTWPACRPCLAVIAALTVIYSLFVSSHLWAPHRFGAPALRIHSLLDGTSNAQGIDGGSSTTTQRLEAVKRWGRRGWKWGTRRKKVAATPLVRSPVHDGGEMG